MPRKLRSPWIGRERGQPNWYIYWHDQSTGRTKRRSSGTCIRAEAEEALGRFLIERSQGQRHATGIQPPDRYKITTAIRWYTQERAEDLAASEGTPYAIDHLLHFFGARDTVSSITPQRLAEYGASRKVSSSTVRRELGVLSAALNHAVKNGRLTSAPKIILPKGGKPKDRYLNRMEIEWLLKGCHESHIRLFIMLGINTGARKGALLDLRWPQADLVNGVMYLNPPGREQTSKRRAIVPINETLRVALIDTHEASIKSKEKREQKGDKTPCTSHIIAFRNQPVLDIKKGFYAACRRAENLHAEWLLSLKEEDPARYKIESRTPFSLKGVTPHTLRHTAGTMMAQAGIDLFMIAKVLGHSVAKTTELYAHHRPDYLRPAMDVLSRLTTNI
jgi:integrase